MKILLSLAIAFCWAASLPAITMDTVPVGNTGSGFVNYAFSIGKFEVTVGQYTEFLNAVAASDTYNLYSLSMTTDLNSAGVVRSGVFGNYTYSAIGSQNHPITYVSWGDAARFTIWLHNGQPSGDQNNATTEDGAYALHGASSDAALFAVQRNADAKWFLPSEPEWSKAAYHQPAAQGGDVDDFWNYPMRTNNLPYSDQPPGVVPDSTRVGNFRRDDGLANGHDDGYAVTGSTTLSGTQNYLTDVGAYSSSPSFYGTFDQGGNVYEWNEARINGYARGLRGGSWDGFAEFLAKTELYNGYPTDSDASFGFRVATIPEPQMSILALIASVSLYCLRHHRRCT